MKTKLLVLALLAGTSLFARSRVVVNVGVGVGPAYGYGYYAPPPPRPVYMSYRPACPGPGYHYVDGYWDWGGRGYSWRPGYWARPPYAGARWVRPAYHGKRHYRGHWRR